MRWLDRPSLPRPWAFQLKVFAFRRSSSLGARGDTNLLAQPGPRGPSSVCGVSVSEACPRKPYLCTGLPSLLCLVIVALYYCPAAEGGVVAVAEAAKQGRPVTYGSAISLVHAATGYKLFSGKISWGSGSGQQAVTAMPSEERPASGNVLWAVTVPPGSNRQVPLDSRELQKQIGTKSVPAAVEGSETDPVPALPTDGEAGVPVRCGSVIALEHATSAGRLQAVGAPSPLSNNREVGLERSRRSLLQTRCLDHTPVL
ncbi:transmembrane protein [Cystoisospora suis]|uniref:Transmembrane protein n=1 Tax=Cystoisospora suis TaxID=483139 RepID=A0A2C6KS97_9APIC|nr:transmembrane protein [Cystoisospora suis]